MNFEKPTSEDPNSEGPKPLEVYLKGKSDEDLATMTEDPLDVITTIDMGADAHPTNSFSEEQLKEGASAELESRNGSDQ